MLQQSAETAAEADILGSSTCCLVVVDTLQVRLVVAVAVVLLGFVGGCGAGGGESG